MSGISNELDAYIQSESMQFEAEPCRNPANTKLAGVDLAAVDLAAVEQRYGLWRGRSVVNRQEALSTGHKNLDDSIHIGGWPRAGLLEVLMPQPGVQELTLLMPAIAQHLKPQQRVAFIGLPYLILPSVIKQFGIKPQQIWCVQTPQINDQLWAMQQLLKSGHCLMVLAWQFNKTLRNDSLRKLQVAAKSGQSCGVVFRHERCQQEASPASMRIHLSGSAHQQASTTDTKKGDYSVGDITLKLLKQPKSFAGQTLTLSHALKEHQQLIRQGLPEFTVDKQIVLNRYGKEKLRGSELSAIKNKPDKQLFSLRSLNS